MPGVCQASAEVCWVYEGQVLWGGVSEGGLGEAWEVVQEKGVQEGREEEEDT